MLSSIRNLWEAPWTFWIGLRYLKSKKNSKFLSLITLMSILGVALGVTAMIVVLSVMDGFEAELKKRLMSTDLHVLVTPTKDVQGFDSSFVPQTAFDPQAVLARLPHREEVAQIFPVVSTEGI